MLLLSNTRVTISINRLINSTGRGSPLYCNDPYGCSCYFTIFFFPPLRSYPRADHGCCFATWKSGLEAAGGRSSACTRVRYKRAWFGNKRERGLMPFYLYCMTFPLSQRSRRARRAPNCRKAVACPAESGRQRGSAGDHRTLIHFMSSVNIWEQGTVNYAKGGISWRENRGKYLQRCFASGSEN